MKYKYFDKKYLNLTNHIARDIVKYNRSVPQEIIDALPEDKFFPVVFSMVHEHIAGKIAEPHMRCMIVVPVKIGNDDIMNRILVDVEMGIFDLLPEFEMPTQPEPVLS
jgi:hypothetical protein